MVLINLHRNLHEKSSFLSEIMFIRINPYLCHLLTRYQSTIFPNHKSCVRKKGVPSSVVFISGCRHDTLSRRRVGDSNPRYSNPVRQFSKLVVSATHPTLRSPFRAFILKRVCKYRIFLTKYKEMQSKFHFSIAPHSPWR